MQNQIFHLLNKMLKNKKETILITGSEGFIGKNLEMRFKENNQRILYFNKNNNESELKILLINRQ